MQLSPARWQKVEPLLDAALDLPADQRAAFLDSACIGDGELRVEVERLLQACAESRHFLQEPAEAFAAPILASLASDRDPAAPGARIGPYRLIEEVGRGGMAVVYLAERDDGEFRMRVALKLVRAGVIPEDESLRRFREERQILASLEHPGIARLLDGGVTDDGVPWFALEYVDGTPVEQYCDERRLSFEARLELFCAVCDAVQHAHARGIVHRDLKPGNILVSPPDGELTTEPRVKLLDFGIAKLLAAPRAGEPAEQTRPGLRLMTPEYASPEQVRGEAVTPAADVYALGVLLYRLLCGSHPHELTGGTGQRVPGTWPEPGDLDAIVPKALSKQAEQRYASAGELGAEVRGYLQRARVEVRPEARRRRVLLALGAATFALALALAAWFGRDEGTATVIDPAAIVVAPFRVSADASFDYLSEGLVDLLATSLNGETGSRAVDPRASIAAWRTASRGGEADVPRSSAQAIARRLGAGQLLMGSLVGTPARLTLNAALFDAVRETVLIRISVHGSEDSLHTLVDAVVRQLLAREAQVPRHQFAAVTTTSLPALRSYLAGRQSSRLGHYAQAVGRFEDALRHDSTFTLAAIHLSLAVGAGPLTAAAGTRQRALRLAWAGRDRLGTPDRLFLEAIAGPRYPEPTPRHELLEAYSRAVNASPDRPEALALMGAFHVLGILRGEPNALQRSSEYFGRALALDSSYARPAYNRVREAAAAGDTATVQRIVRRYLSADSASEMAQLLAWIQAAVSGDQRAILEIRARMPAMHPSALGWIVFHALMFGRDMDGAEAALAALRLTVRSEREWENHRFREWEYLGNRGRLAELQSRLEEAARETEGFGPIEELGLSAERRALAQRAVHLVRTALFWGGDTTGIGEAIALLEDSYRRSPAATGEPFARLFVADGACFAGMGRIAEGDGTRARAAAVRLHQLLDGGLEVPNRTHHALCAATLDALIAVAENRPDARRQVERADSMLTHAPPGRMIASRTQLLLARAFDALGDPEAGLRTIRRRSVNNPAYFLATILAEEGHLAARAGDREGAIRAYRHYLVLRTHPDPALVPDVQRVRKELAELLVPR
jgi:tetratricopeptide (TPR) repeat protein/tRNA A-37 threonylcarbamoyl transferase component Bud32